MTSGRDLRSSTDALRPATPPGGLRFKLLGALMILSGIVAAFLPLVSGLSAASVLGAVLVVAGAGEVWDALSSRDWPRDAWQLLLGLFGMAGGVMVHLSPFTGTIGATFLLALVFVAQGVAFVVLAKEWRPADGWGWLMAAGLIAFVVSCLFVLKLPFTSLWATCSMAAASLVVGGIGFLLVGTATARARAAVS
jgi:uncharacterized membrane protein HdeD (DUF308 family)